MLAKPLNPNGFADHDPVFKWLAIIGKINPTFSDKPILDNTRYMLVIVGLFIQFPTNPCSG